MNQGNTRSVAAAAVLTVGLLTDCSTPGHSDIGALSTFASMDEAHAAVDGVLGCDVDPVGDPIVPADGGALTSEQKLCLENVQIDLYPDENALRTALEIWTGSAQGEVQLVRGANWMVVDVTGVATGESTLQDIEGLAEELNGEFSVSGT